VWLGLVGGVAGGVAGADDVEAIAALRPDPF